MDLNLIMQWPYPSPVFRFDITFAHDNNGGLSLVFWSHWPKRSLGQGLLSSFRLTERNRNNGLWWLKVVGWYWSMCHACTILLLFISLSMVWFEINEDAFKIFWIVVCILFMWTINRVQKLWNGNGNKKKLLKIKNLRFLVCRIKNIIWEIQVHDYIRKYVPQTFICHPQLKI